MNHILEVLPYLVTGGVGWAIGTLHQINKHHRRTTLNNYERYYDDHKN